MALEAVTLIGVPSDAVDQLRRLWRAGALTREQSVDVAQGFGLRPGDLMVLSEMGLVRTRIRKRAGQLFRGFWLTGSGHDRAVRDWPR